MTLSCYRCSAWPCECRDGVTLIHGDCREVLPLLPAVDLVVTDPPYGIGHRPAALNGQEATWQGNEIAGDDDPELRDSVLNDFSNVACFAGWKSPPLPRAHTAIIWDKGPACGGMNFHAPWRMNWELIFIRGKAFSGGMDLGVICGHWIPTWQGHGKFHQHQKPLSLMKYLLSKAANADAVLDPFFGSGTTLLAAKEVGKRAIGIEIEERYCEIAANRLRQEVLQFTD